MTPRYPVYIVSKGRSDYSQRLTSRALDRMGVPYHIIVEAHEADHYRAVIDPAKVLVLDPAYQERYDTCDDLGATKSRGPGPARNFAWDHAVAAGAASHWVMDDNIGTFYRLHRNTKIPLGNGTAFAAMEEFCDRYLNVGMAGPNYEFFAPRKAALPVMVLNTRIYSCNLIRNDLPFRWRGRYNEDTDLSLRILKAGWVTISFNAFLQKKRPTQTVAGGCTTDFYAREGTGPKTRMQVQLHPDVSRIVYRFGRIHHHVDYRRFQSNRLVRRADVDVPTGPDEYGLRLVQGAV
jgi:TET-Associated Glycosyltransferase